MRMALQSDNDQILVSRYTGTRKGELEGHYEWLGNVNWKLSVTAPVQKL